MNHTQSSLPVADIPVHEIPLPGDIPLPLPDTTSTRPDSVSTSTQQGTEPVKSQPIPDLIPAQDYTSSQQGMQKIFFFLAKRTFVVLWLHNTVEFPLADTPPMWTLLPNGHFLPGPFIFPI